MQPASSSAFNIAQTREVSALDVINGVADLRGYPFRHLGLVAAGGLPMTTQTEILVATEILSQWGWHLVSVLRPSDSSRTLVAFLRRV